jgi:hypothetical protein
LVARSPAELVAMNVTAGTLEGVVTFLGPALAALLLLRLDPSPQRITLIMAAALLSILGLAYSFNILPPIWGYSRFGFLFPHEQEAPASTSTPLPASTATGKQISAPKALSIYPSDGIQEVGPQTTLRLGFDLPTVMATSIFGTLRGTIALVLQKHFGAPLVA